MHICYPERALQGKLLCSCGKPCATVLAEGLQFFAPHDSQLHYIRLKPNTLRQLANEVELLENKMKAAIASASAGVAVTV